MNDDARREKRAADKALAAQQAENTKWTPLLSVHFFFFFFAIIFTLSHVFIIVATEQQGPGSHSGDLFSN